MIDLVFDLSGDAPPASYPFTLWTELTRLAPQLETSPNIGVLPLRLSESRENTLLPKRTKLTVRLPTEFADETSALLSEQKIGIDDLRMQLGVGKKRVIQAYPTIHSHMVAGKDDEVMFMEEITEQLKELGVAGNLICGKRHSLTGERQSINCYSLVVHDLKADASLKLQYAGLGNLRQFGCGIFIPYKVITGLDDD